MTGIYKSQAGEAIMQDWYNLFLSKLTYPSQSCKVSTQLGETSVIITGPEDAIPILCIHGGLAGAPHMLGELGDFPSRYRVYAVDVVGQSVASSQVRPNVNSPEFAQWLSEVLDQLGLSTVFVMGVSWGGFVAINLAVYAPERIRGMVLLNPAGLVRGSNFAGMTKFYLPLMFYQLFPTEARRDWAFKSLFTTPGELWSSFMADAMKHTITDFALPPLVQKSELKNLNAPVFIFGSDQDLFFPGPALLSRASEVFPNLIGTHLFKNCRHCPPFDASFTEPWVQQLEDIFQEDFLRERSPVR